MKLTITREQLQEGLVAVAASVPAKTTLPILSNILLEATKDGNSSLGHRPRHRREHDGVGLGRSGGGDHVAGAQAGRDRPRAPQCRHPAHRLRRAAGDDRVRPLQVPAAGPPTRGVSGVPDGQVRRQLADVVEGPAEADRARGFRREHGGEPADPEWRALGAPSRADADGGHQRPPAGPDGRAHPAVG